MINIDKYMEIEYPNDYNVEEGSYNIDDGYDAEKGEYNMDTAYNVDDNHYNMDEDDYDDDERPIGIPIFTSNTFYSDFIGNNTKYININEKNSNNNNNYNFINFKKLIKNNDKNNNKYYINTIYGELYVGDDINNLDKLNIKGVFIFDISSDGNFLVYTNNNEVNMYNLKTNKNEVIKNIGLNICDNNNNKYIKDIMFTPDNSRLIYSQNEHIYIWNISENKLDDKINTDVINFTANNNHILISNYNKFSIYDINSKKIINNKQFDNNIIKEMKIINDTIIIGFIDGSIVIMNINSESKDYTYFRNNYGGIKDISISENNNYMACVDNNDVLSVFDINTRQHIYSLSGFRVSSIIITNKLEIIGSGHFNSISHFVMPKNVLNNILNS
jgi:hypothetical protein